jgi:Xaa-Pro aminopeptidase
MTRSSIANLPRLSSLMARDDFDAIIARSGVNFTYLAGLAYPGTLGRHLELADSPRPVYVVWPRNGEPVAIVNPLAEALTRRDSCIERVIVYTSYTDDPLSVLGDVLLEMGLSHGRVGYEESYLSARQLDSLTTRLPKLRLADCTRLMDEVRWIKTPGEVALIKRGADLLDEAFLEVFGSMTEGETERSAHSRIVAACMQRGSSFAHGWMASSRNTVPAGGQSDLAFQRGDVVRTDYVAYFDGYPGHQSRNAVIGKPTAEQTTIYGRVRDIYLATIDQCRPGMAAGAIFHLRLCGEAICGGRVVVQSLARGPQRGMLVASAGADLRARKRDATGDRHGCGARTLQWRMDHPGHGIDRARRPRAALGPLQYPGALRHLKQTRWGILVKAVPRSY